MVLVSVSLILMFYTRAALWLHGVLYIMAGLIKSNPVLALSVTLALIAAGVMKTISIVVNPSHPPFSVVLLFRQVRESLGLPKAVTNLRMLIRSYKLGYQPSWPRSV